MRVQGEMPVVLGSTSILHPSISYDASGNKIGGASLGWYTPPPPSLQAQAPNPRALLGSQCSNAPMALC